MLDPDRYIAKVTKSCHQCAATAQLPAAVDVQSTAKPLPCVGSQVCIDIMKQNRQLLLVARESITSYTTVLPVPSEKVTDLRDTILSTCLWMVPMDGPATIVRTDPAPGFCALEGDETLLSARLPLEVGQIKIPKKNPVAEHAIQEFQIELKKCQPTGGPATPISIAKATHALNTRIRARGLSSRKKMCLRDQFSGYQISVSDEWLIDSQHEAGIGNHEPSSRSKASGKHRTTTEVTPLGNRGYCVSPR